MKNILFICGLSFCFPAFSKTAAHHDQCAVIPSSSSSHRSSTFTLPPPLISGELKIALVFFNFSNNSTTPWDRESMRALIFDGPNSSKSFWSENSYGKLNLRGHLNENGDVYGYYQLTQNSSICAGEDFANEANDLASVHGFNPENYHVIIYFFPPPTGLCPSLTAWAEWGPPHQWTGPRKIWVRSPIGSPLFSHEIGHTLGLLHSNSLYCTQSGIPVTLNSTFPSLCTPIEYGDPHDTMGQNQNLHYHVNGAQKLSLDFFDESQTQIITRPGVYTIYPLAENTNQKKVLILPLAKNSSGDLKEYYSLEYRADTGFDNFPPLEMVTEGARLIYHFSTLNDSAGRPVFGSPYLLDSHPTLFGTSPLNFVDAVFLPEMQWRDPLRKKWIIKILGKHEGGMLVKVHPIPERIYTEPTHTIHIEREDDVREEGPDGWSGL